MTAGTNRIGNNNLTDYKGAEVDNVPMMFKILLLPLIAL